MKLWSKEALVLGGIYGVLEIPFSLLGFESLSGILFLLFIAGMLLLCFNKISRFLLCFMSKYPQISYYLCAIGWIPYFIFIVFTMLIVSGYIIDYSDTVVKYSMGIILYPYTAIYLAIVSLLVAYVRTKINK